MYELSHKVSIEYIEKISLLLPEIVELVSESRKAVATSYSPYSKFAVGAAILLFNGEIVTGSNQENASYPSGLCAERVALFSASARYPAIGIKAIAIHAPTFDDSLYPLTPCGSCLQVLSEFGQKQPTDIQIILTGKGKGAWKAKSVMDFLPFPFKLK